jgi:hypothetical protein
MKEIDRQKQRESVHKSEKGVNVRVREREREIKKEREKGDQGAIE